ncbi:MAG: ROK family protein [Clostridia bacterium]|nr:ROK family protein [Clostridia bacterium]
MFTIGVDIGGMSVKIGLVDDNGKIVEQLRVKTVRDANKGILDIIDSIKYLLSNNKIETNQLCGIGIGCPGAVKSEEGIIDYLPNLGWDTIDVRTPIEKAFGVPVMVSNDANVAALGEVIYGSAKGCQTCVMFTIGTGVGGGMIINGKLFEGGFSRGGELGHMTLIMDGEDCSCGRKGCVECYTSATALIKQTKEEMKKNRYSMMWKFVDYDIKNVDGRTAFECSKLGDKSAIKVRDKYIEYLGESILNMFNIFRPEVFIIGGGISAQGEYLTNLLKGYCEKFDYGYKRSPRTEIITASLGNDAGIIGAAALLKQ